ncbi:MAG: ribonuclease III [Anaerolineales bacterium]|nr:ribonuclease III [Anaerolineales bacterium]
MVKAQENIPVESPQQFAKRLGLNFSNPLLLSRALTHRSYLNEHPEALEDNERMEFLGDAVLDFVVGAWLYNSFPEMSEGDMTRLRAALVKTEQLAEFADDIEMGLALRLGRGEQDSGGRTRPAMLCACFEALIGAMYLDSGIVTVEKFTALMLEEAADRILAGHHDRDPKSLLQEWAQSQGYSAPHYKIISENGPDHEKIFEVEVLINGEAYGRGIGRSKQAASKVAARLVLKELF